MSKNSNENKKNKEAKNLYLDREIADKAERIAKNSPHRSLSGLVEHLLIRKIKQHENQKG